MYLTYLVFIGFLHLHNLNDFKILCSKWSSLNTSLLNLKPFYPQDFEIPKIVEMKKSRKLKKSQRFSKKFQVQKLT